MLDQRERGLRSQRGASCDLASTAYRSACVK